MRVRWHEFCEVPEEYRTEDYELPPPVRRAGEVIGIVKSFFGGLNLVVMLDDGRVVEVDADQVRKDVAE